MNTSFTILKKKIMDELGLIEEDMTLVTSSEGLYLAFTQRGLVKLDKKFRDRQEYECPF